MFDDEPFNPSQRQAIKQRRRFTLADDEKLKKIVSELGIHDWEAIARKLKGRSARQCRDRYNNYLYKDIIRKEWTPEEDTIIIKKHQEIGPHWMQISEHLNGRSGNQVKNRWYKHIVKHIESVTNSEEKMEEKSMQLDNCKNEENRKKLAKDCLILEGQSQIDIEQNCWDEYFVHGEYKEDSLQILYL